MNQMKNIRSYTHHKNTRRRNETAKHWRYAASLGHGSDIDGRQAIIDLMTAAGTRMAPELYQSLVDAGYDIPEAIRPRDASADDSENVAERR